MNLAQVLYSGRSVYPDAMAIHQGEHHLTYERAFNDVERVAGHLFEAGVRPGQIVATDLQRPISHWLILLSLMRLGAVSVSLTDNFAAESSALSGISAVVSALGDTRSYPPGLHRIRMEADWLSRAPTLTTALPEAAEAARSGGRICFTSGTSGRPKAILLDAGLLRARLSGTAKRSRLNTRSVLWCGLGPDSAYGFTATLAAWLEGGSVVLSGGGPGSYRYLSERHVNLLIASPVAIASLLRDASTTDLPRLRATAIVAGGRLTIALRDALLNRVCTDVKVAYGSSEAGGITLGDAAGLDRHPGEVGGIFSDVEARIVNEGGSPVPAGTAGRLLVRTPSLVKGYLNDPASTAESFDDGWFRCGDEARIDADRTLTMLGRPADVLNLGGVKIAAEALDAIAREEPGVIDACAVLLPAGNAGQQLALVIAGQAPAGEPLAARIRAALPLTPRFCIVSVASIARGSMGKVNRDALAEEVAAALEGSAADATASRARRLGFY